MRYERKFIVEENFSKRISNFLYENKFIKEYPTRNINSIYYDSLDFIRFFESEEGISDRNKLRIRFYDDPQFLRLEKKIKLTDIVKKEISFEDDFRTEESFDFNLKNCDNEKFSVSVPRKISCNIPSLFVSYKRDYFNFFEENIRITIDYKLRFGKVRNGSSLIKSPFNINCDFGVLEAKYDSEKVFVPILSKLTDIYSLTLSRCSKYCYGINSCY